MNDTPTFDPQRSEGIRSALVDTVEATATAPLRARSRRWLGLTVFAVAGIVTGGAVSGAAAAFTAGQPGPELIGPGPSAPTQASAVPAPPGVTPGAPIVSLLGSTVSTHVHGATTIPLGDIPEGATHVRVTMECVTPGATSWGTDPAGNNPSTSCSARDVDGATSSSYYDFPLDASITTLTIRAESVVESLISYQFVNYVPTAFGVNENGEIFGANLGETTPDLVAVVGHDEDGDLVDGYARATDLYAFGPDWPGQPSNPDEALAWQKDRDARYPDGWDVPIWESDGSTRIGTFHIGG